MQSASRDLNRRPAEGGTGGVPSWAWKVTAPPPTLPLPLLSSSSPSAAASSGFSNTATTAALATPSSASLRFDPPSSSSHHRWKSRSHAVNLPGSWHFPPSGRCNFFGFAPGWFLVVDWIRNCIFIPLKWNGSLFRHSACCSGSCCCWRLTNFNLWDWSTIHCVENHCWTINIQKYRYHKPMSASTCGQSSGTLIFQFLSWLSIRFLSSLWSQLPTVSSCRCLFLQSYQSY